MDSKKDTSGTRVIRRELRPDGSIVEHVVSNHPATHPEPRRRAASNYISEFLADQRARRGVNDKPGPW